MLLSVSHAFEECMPSTQHATFDSSSDCDFGSGTETGDESEDDEDLMESTSNTSFGSWSGTPYVQSTRSTQEPSASVKRSFRSLVITNWLSDTGGVLPELSDTQMPSIQDLQLLGHLVHSSIDQDWALIDITNDGLKSEL